jgi:hypothetical protein
MELVPVPVAQRPDTPQPDPSKQRPDRVRRIWGRKHRSPSYDDATPPTIYHPIPTKAQAKQERLNHYQTVKAALAERIRLLMGRNPAECNLDNLPPPPPPPPKDDIRPAPPVGDVRPAPPVGDVDVDRIEPVEVSSPFILCTNLKLSSNLRSREMLFLIKLNSLLNGPPI